MSDTGDADYVTSRSDKRVIVKFDQAYFDAFCDSVKNGTNTEQTLFGYDDVNKIVSRLGLITYMGSNEDVPMVTVFTLASGAVTVTENEELYTWFAE